MKTKITTLDVVAVLALSVVSFFPGAMAQERQKAAPELIEEFPKHPVHQLDKPSPLAIEYRMISHVEAISRKWGQLDKVKRFCGISGAEYEEVELVETLYVILGSGFNDGIAAKAKEEYSNAPNPLSKCWKSGEAVTRLALEIDRHKGAIIDSMEKLNQIKGGNKP